jgi:xanthine/uracil/vitamin C permease (AzgA family)
MPLPTHPEHRRLSFSPRIQVEAEAHQVDSLYAINGLASMAAAILGIPPLIVHAECIAGVGEGGRTGGTAIYTGAFFLLSIFLQPLLKVGRAGLHGYSTY